jgi:hypothetical protein
MSREENEEQMKWEKQEGNKRKNGKIEKDKKR